MSNALTGHSAPALPPEPLEGRRRPRDFAALALVLGLPVLLTLPQWRQLGLLWQSELGSAHGWLIALVAVYLAIEMAGGLQAARRVSWPMLCCLGAASILYVLSGFAHVEIAQQLLLPVLVLSLVGVCYGPAGARRLAFPILYVVFAIPVWDFFVPLLQALTVAANGLLLPLAGIPARIDGDLVTVPAGVFEVAGGCAGEHFFIVALAISTLYSYLRGDGPRAALVSIGTATVLALVTNWLRVFVIIARGQATAMQTSLIRDHYWFGWWLFAGALLIYFLLMRWLNPAPLAPARRVVAPASPAALPLGAGAGLLALVLGFGYLHERAYESLPDPKLVAPSLSAPFAGPLIEDVDFRPVFPGAAAEHLATYQSPTLTPLAYYQVAYGAQGLGRKLIGFESSVLPQGWRLIARGRAVLPTGQEVTATEARTTSGARALIYSWYVIGGHATASSARARLYMAAQAASAVTHSKLLAVATICRPDCETAAGTLATFVAKLHPET